MFQLEDRITPADITLSGTTAFIDLDVSGERVSFSTTTPGVISVDSTGGVTVSGSPVSPPFLLSGVDRVVVTDAAVGTGVEFVDSTVAYTAAFTITLDDDPGRVSFNGRSAFGANDLSVTTARDIGVFGGEVTTTSGNINFSANQQAVASSGFFDGVFIEGSVQSDTGIVSMAGRGGDDPDAGFYGIWISSGEVSQSTTVSGASVNLIGTGGSSSNFNLGVSINGLGTTVASTGGDVTVIGTGGGDGSPNNNWGVEIAFDATVVAGGSGNVFINGIGGGGGSDFGVVLSSTPLVTAGANSEVTIQSDSLSFSNSPLVSAGTVTLRPHSPGLPIDFGGADMTGDTLLRVSPVELSAISTTTLVIGGPTAGSIRISTDVFFSSATNLRLVSGDTIVSSSFAGAIDTGGGTLTYSTPTGVLPLRGGADATASLVSFTAGSDLRIGVSTASPNFEEQWLAVDGGVDLSAADLVLSNGGGVILPTDVFTIVSAATVTGTFNGFPNGALVSLPGAPVPFRIFYSPTAVILRANQPPTGLSAGGPYAITEGEGLTLVATATDPDGDVLTFTWDVNGDGVYGDEAIGTSTAGGQTVTFTPAQMASLGLGEGPITVSPLGVRVSDGFGGSATASTTLTVADRVAPPLVVSNAGRVRVFTPSGELTLELVPFPGYRGDISVALGDLNRDGTPEVVVAAGDGGSPHVKVYDITGAELASFFAYDPAFKGGVFVAATGDGRIVTGAGPGGGPHVKAFDITGAELASFFAYDPGFTGGVRVSAGDLNGDGTDDIVTGAGPDGAPHVKAFDGRSLSVLSSFFAFDPQFNGGVFVAVTLGRIAVGAGTWGAPHVKVFDADGTTLASFFAFPTTFLGGVRLKFADADADGDQDLVVGPGLGGGLPVRTINLPSLSEIGSFNPFSVLDPLGVFVG